MAGSVNERGKGKDFPRLGSANSEKDHSTTPSPLTPPSSHLFMALRAHRHFLM